MVKIKSILHLGLGYAVHYINLNGSLIGFEIRAAHGVFSDTNGFGHFEGSIMISFDSPKLSSTMEVRRD